jgi:hypothetical protein
MNKPKDVAPDPTTGTIGCAAILDAEDSTGKNTAEKAAANQSETVEKFSSPFDQLKRAEKGQVKLGGRALHDARGEVLLALHSCRHSRSQLGKALHEYKEFFISEGGWMLAVQAIGEVLARDERTVRNMVADYERVAELVGAVYNAGGQLVATMNKTPEGLATKWKDDDEVGTVHRRCGVDVGAQTIYVVSLAKMPSAP